MTEHPVYQLYGLAIESAVALPLFRLQEVNKLVMGTPAAIAASVAALAFFKKSLRFQFIAIIFIYDS